MRLRVWRDSCGAYRRKDRRVSRHLFVVLEGIDGSGKTTVGQLTTRALNESGIPCVYVKSPSEPFSVIASDIARIDDVDVRFMFFLASVRHISEQIREKLANASVICDRYIYSTLA